MVLHIVGDTGGVKYPVPQEIVAMAQEQQFDGSDTAARPSFFYHLGDVVYYNGEASEYYSQFYEPYSHYSAPIFAIPGNHDGDVMPGGAAVRARRLLRRVTPARVLARSRKADRQLHARAARASADRHG
jgi:hypothetical protein